MAKTTKQEIPKKVKRLIIIVSIVIPTLVAILLSIPPIDGLGKEAVEMFRKLPTFYAGINALTAILLVVALIAIKQKNIALHQKLMTTNLLLSVIFLLCYVVYHATVPATSFGGEGGVRTVYFLVLISHIALSVVVVPLVLVSYMLAANNLIDKHRRIAKITFPIWLYVAITGVVVYLMISPYYPQ